MYFISIIGYSTPIQKRMKLFHLQQHGWKQQTLCKRNESYIKGQMLHVLISMEKTKLISER